MTTQISHSLAERTENLPRPVSFPPNLIEIVYLDARAVADGTALSKCERGVTFDSVPKALATARKLIRQNKVWMDCVELHVERGPAWASVDSQTFDVFLHHTEKWSSIGFPAKRLTQFPHVDSIKV